jgi:hypothetical protein
VNNIILSSYMEGWRRRIFTIEQPSPRGYFVVLSEWPLKALTNVRSFYE